MIIGTAGHIDHGKTTLVKALTGVDCDRLKEEKARGITLDLGYAYTPLPAGGTLGFIDVPGHEKLIHNMLAGATGIDFALLVIAADDGPMPQTREHLDIVELLGIRQGAVALTKIDAVSPERLAQAKAEIADLLAGTALAEAPLFPVAAVTGQGIAALRAHLDRMAAEIGERTRQGGFRLAIDRCFTLSGAGTVVTGTAFSGMVKAGDPLLLSPPGKTVRVRSLRVQDTAAESGHAGQRIALALAGIEKSEIDRGMWLLAPVLHAPTRRFDATLRVLPGQPPLKHWTQVHLHLGAEDVPARIALLGADEIPPGGEHWAQITLERDIGALAGDRFILRDAAARHTIGGGRVLDPFPPSRHRRRPDRLALLADLGAFGDEAQAVEVHVGAGGHSHQRPVFQSTARGVGLGAGHGQRAGRFEHRARVLEDVLDRRADGVGINAYDLVDVLLAKSESFLADIFHRRAVGKQTDLFQAHALAGSQRLRHGVSIHRFDADDFRLRTQPLDVGGDAGDQPAAAHRYEDRIQRRRVLAQDSQGQLRQTLLAWCRHDGHPQACADELGIHRNTLRYRLERIGELSGLDLTRRDQRLLFTLGLELLDD